MFQLLLRAALAVTTALALIACDTASDDDGGNDGPLTGCDLGYQNEDTSLKGIGEACAADGECAYGECFMPTEGGNNVNEAFGFCTRGCDCNNDPASRIADEDKPVFECVYPSGFPDRHFVALECGDVNDCQAFASGWNQCGQTLDNTGTIKKVCTAE